VENYEDRRSPHPPRRSFSYACKVVPVFVGEQPLIPVRRIVPSSPGLEVQGTTELRRNGVLRSSQRSEPSEPSGGRGFPCFPSREEFAYGQEQTRKREYDEHYLVDVIFSGRQAAYEVLCPEERVIP
jgi:hypothetical protein